MKEIFKIILASGSHPRKDLLNKFLGKYNMDYEIIVSTVDEDVIKKKEKVPSELVKKLSYAKAENVFSKIENIYKNLIVIGADTIVFFENKILGKPSNEKVAQNMLKKLSGKSNKVYTGMTVFIKNDNKIEHLTTCSCSTAYMKDMTTKDINDYIATKEPLDKAGAYTIQGIGKKYVKKYVGRHNTLVGLDTIELKNILKEYKII